MATRKERALALMQTWCDALLAYQVEEFSTEYLHGSLLCPACHIIHGRCADLAYPLVTLWAQTGREAYLRAAVELVDWTEANLVCEGGGYRNDAGNRWTGITAFSAMSLAEALLHYGDRLDSALRERWLNIFARLCGYMIHFYTVQNPNINYSAGGAALFALAHRLLGGADWLERARALERFCRAHFDEQGLLYGEGKPVDAITEKGCRPIDMGYNLEESLPLLIQFSVHAQDAQSLQFYAARMRDHLAFLLPDGAIDNSFGTRHNKWTYWGSRTSDGALEGLAHLAPLDPLFARAADAVLGLYERCTHDGLLYGGPMACDAGEPPCIHHTFCHAKALCELYHYGSESPAGDAPLLTVPEGVSAYQNGNLLLCRVGGWRATVSACDFVYADGGDNGGGSLTLLWHERLGPLCAATMARYTPVEPHNMQYLRNSEETYCLTPHIESGEKLSVCDRSARLTVECAQADCVRVAAQGTWFSFRYEFTPASVRIQMCSQEGGTFFLPLIADKATRVAEQEGEVRIGGLRMRADGAILWPNAKAGRQYSQVGGFEYVRAAFPLAPGEPRQVELVCADE